MAIYQDSSGGVNWQSANHVNADGRVMPRFQGYRVQVGEITVAAGQRAAPVILVYDPCDDRSIAGAIEGFWQNFPKALEVNGPRLTLGVFPGSTPMSTNYKGGNKRRRRCISRSADGGILLHG